MLNKLICINDSFIAQRMHFLDMKPGCEDEKKTFLFTKTEYELWLISWFYGRENIIQSTIVLCLLGMCQNLG